MTELGGLGVERAEFEDGSACTERERGEGHALLAGMEGRAVLAGWDPPLPPSLVLDAPLRDAALLQAAAAGGKQELRSHTLPDGQEITVAHEGHALGEALFDLDGALGASEPGLAEAIHAGIVNSYEPSLRKIVYEHLILCGGLSGLPGIGERLMQELRLLAPPSTIPTLYPFPDYMPDHTKNCSVWMGGAILSKVVFPQSHHMTRGDYDDEAHPERTSDVDEKPSRMIFRRLLIAGHLTDPTVQI
eukprot:CAMPEP_0177579642 /NCGR_PEP_ID=MMETSP0419_2-20121207/1078_1 /TAXON_ID=582737 /ORGANISM="Tetraselmis sp., Strain GSL018" /LENGTH=245 /DNA_ID=CAMNT_0019068341 /DNA_START=86 /DNA_END=825 /DNA_ORIENTATION=-